MSQFTRYEFELNVPSGVMVFADSLPGYDVEFELDRGDQADDKGLSLAYAAIGCARGFVGNSCPGIYRKDNDTILVAATEYDDDGEEKNIPGDRLGSITTDYWSYSFADQADFHRRNGVDHRFKSIDVRPGVYRFEHTLVDRVIYDELFIFARITWIREPDPVTN